MKLEKAIEIVKHPSPLVGHPDWHNYFTATQLLIEAGKREQFNRDNPDFVIVGPLPGETKD